MLNPSIIRADSAKCVRQDLQGSATGFLQPLRVTNRVLFAQRRADFGAGWRTELKLAGRDGGMVRILVGRHDLITVWLKHIGALGKKIVAHVQQ